MTTKASILVVDDEENLRRTLALILQREGYTVMTAASVMEARGCIQAGGFDLVFLDLKMPDASGLTLLPDLRSQYPDMPVLILTAHDKLEIALEAVRGGARDYLLKPIDPPILLARVKEVLAEG
jgi:DNA-binding NtrC family response regulator